MQFELQAQTEAGRRLVALAERLAADFANRADEHDRAGSYPFENIEALKRHRYFVAPIPQQFGGLGVGSVHDILVASSRLARGDASVTIGLNMHLTGVIALARQWRIAKQTGDTARAGALEASMTGIAASDSVIAAAYTEPDLVFNRPRTTATRNGESWMINGRKTFGTMAPAASHISVVVTYIDETETERVGFALVPADTPGVTINDDWDALGMRASGSGSITFEDVRIPPAALRDGFSTEGWSVPMLERFLVSGPMHTAASLGIAETAAEHAVEAVCSRPKRSSGRRAAERPTLQRLAAENAIDLAAMRAIFSRAGVLIDGYHARRCTSLASLEEAHAVFKEAQCAKTFVHEAAIRVVDRALTMSGGAGFLNTSRLSRLYRDVRAGPFMHPLGANMAYEYIGQVTFGLEPVID